MKILIGLRKFIVVILIMLVAVLFRIFDLFNGSEAVELMKSVAIAFIGANLSSKFLDVVIAKFNKDKVKD